MAYIDFMNSMLKKVLSYIAVAFLGFATGIGCLIGVSSCSSSNGNDQQEKQQLKLQPKLRKITFTNDLFNSQTLLYFQAKGYSDNGRKYFKEDNNLNYLPDGGKQIFDGTLNLAIQMDLVSRNQIQVNTFQVRSTDMNGQHYLSNVRFWKEDNSGYVNLFRISTNSAEFLFLRENCAFICKNLKATSLYPLETQSYIINYLFDVYNIEDYYSSFDFTEQTNYNAFLNTNVDTFLNRAMYPVADYMTSSGSSVVERTFETPLFKSNGLVFNRIKAIYRPNLGQSFEFSDGHFATVGNPLGNYLVYFSSLHYINVATGLDVVVASRTSVGEGDNVNENKILYKLYWTSDAFRHLEFTNEITDLLLKYTLTSANSGYDTTQYQSQDVGLGNVFSLLSLAFSAWVPILQIQIVPGITIGLLLFLPLISGIIILVIWIVKR